MLSVEIGLFHRTARKAFQRLLHKRLLCGKVVRLCGRLALGLLSMHPAMDNVHLGPQQGQDKSLHPGFLLILKLNPLEPTQSATGPRSCQTHVVMCPLIRQSWNKQGKSQSHERGRGEEGAGGRASLFPRDYISLGLEQTRCFYKRTNQFPKLSRVFDRFPLWLD